MGRLEFDDGGKYDRACRGRDRGDRELAADVVACEGEVRLGRLDMAHEGLGVLDESPGRRSEPYTAPDALQQLHPGLGLQGRHVVRHGWRRQVQRMSCSGDCPPQLDLSQYA